MLGQRVGVYMKELDQDMKELEQEEQQEIEQVPNTYYYDKIYDDNHLGSFTESTKLAYELGWQDNTVAITDTEVSDLTGWTYLKGYAPKKTEEQKLSELAAKIRSKRNSLLAETDYLLMNDYPITAENLTRIKKYRQLLRDITKQENFPTAVVFPEFPTM